MLLVCDSVTYDTALLAPVALWHNGRAPDDPYYQRYLAWRLPHGEVLVWVRTGARRGQLNRVVRLTPTAWDTFRRATLSADKRRSLARILATPAEGSRTALRMITAASPRRRSSLVNECRPSQEVRSS